MNKLAVLLAMVLSMVQICFAATVGPIVENIPNSDESVLAIPVASTATIYSHSFSLKSNEYFSIAYKGSSASSTPDLLIQLEQSWTIPTTEGSSDTNYVIPENMPNIETNLVTETWHIKAFSPCVMPYSRIKVTGNASNTADAVIYLKYGHQEK